MSIDIYSPRVMIPRLREIKPVRTFLRDMFFSQARTYRVENIDIDTQEKGRRVAPFVNRWAPGKFVERLGLLDLERRAALHRDEDRRSRAGRLDPRRWASTSTRTATRRSARSDAPRRRPGRSAGDADAARGDDVPRRHLHLCRQQLARHRVGEDTSMTFTSRARRR
jgi:hypothetical protein